MPMSNAPKNPSDAIEIELIRSLYDGIVPSIIMSLGFAIGGTLIAGVAADPILTWLLYGGILASVMRIVIVRRDGRRATAVTLMVADARALERRFAIAYIAFAAMLGLFAARAFMKAGV